MKEKSLGQQIKEANRVIYNDKTPEQYNKNESIFNEHRKTSCFAILKNAASVSGEDKFLDIGTGTGNLLRLGEKIFKKTYGADISENLLAQIKDDFPECFLFASDAEKIPVKDESINCVSCYAMLHHLLNHEKIFKECFRILKDGGTLYTDHDPNYFLNRFYHLFYKIRYRKKKGFGSDLEELAEYHNTYSSGINPVTLKKILLEMGFREVKIIYRITDKTNLSGLMKIIIPFLRIVTKMIPAKSFFTHFAIIARK